MDLYHHGILGQRWGKKNGPPYPLDAKDHSVSEKKAGWKKSLSRDSSQKSKRQESYSRMVSRRDPAKRKGLTTGQKVAIGVGITAVAVVAAYGLYKYGDMNSKAIETGEKFTEQFNGVKALPKHIVEWPTESLKNANPLRGSKEGENNCTACSIAGLLRTMGYKVTAKGTGGERKLLGGIVEECFKGVHVYDGSAVKFGKSPEDAASMLRKKFGDNAKGVCSIKWAGRDTGHAFSWVIDRGMVRFMDFQFGKDDDFIRSTYWQKIDKLGNLSFARLDGDKVEINWDNLSKYVDW